MSNDRMKMSNEVKDAIHAALKRSVESHFIAEGGGNPDPDYSEFWVETRPKDPDPPMPDDGRVRRLNDILMNNALRADGTLVADAWSEEVWTEVGRDWAEMNPEPPDDKPRNTLISMSVRTNGTPIEKDFYKEALRTIANTRDRG